MDKQTLPFLLFCTFLTFAGQAQSSAWGEPFAALDSYTDRPADTRATTYRHYKKLPQLFTGYAIEVAYSDDPLTRTDPIFRQFGNIKYEKLSQGGYSYLITCRFSSREAALQFLRTVILPKVDDARLYTYTEGIRQIIRPEE